MTDTTNSRLRAIGQRLAQAVRDAGGNVVVSQDVGISTRSLSRYLSGDVEMPVLTAQQLAAATKKSLIWLLTGEGDDSSVVHATMPTGDSVLIPMLNVQAASGAGVENGHVEVVDRLPFSTTLLRELGVSPEHAHFIRNRGDSNEPTIADGAIVLVDASRRRIRDDGLYALVVDGDVRIKRVQKSVGGAVTLISDNPRYAPEAVDQPDRLHIEGKVFWAGGGI